MIGKAVLGQVTKLPILSSILIVPTGLLSKEIENRLRTKLPNFNISKIYITQKSSNKITKLPGESCDQFLFFTKYECIGYQMKQRSNVNIKNYKPKHNHRYSIRYKATNTISPPISAELISCLIEYLLTNTMKYNLYVRLPVRSTVRKRVWGSEKQRSCFL